MKNKILFLTIAALSASGVNAEEKSMIDDILSTDNGILSESMTSDSFNQTVQGKKKVKHIENYKLSEQDMSDILTASRKYDEVQQKIMIQEKELRLREIESRIRALNKEEAPPESVVMLKMEVQHKEEMAELKKSYEDNIENLMKDMNSKRQQYEDIIDSLKSSHEDEMTEFEGFQAEEETIEKEDLKKIFTLGVKTFGNNTSAEIYYQNHIYSVQEGDVISNAFTVKEITNDRAILKYGKETLIAYPSTKENAYFETYKSVTRFLEEEQSESEQQDLVDFSEEYSPVNQF